jgi:hypothetical protein
METNRDDVLRVAFSFTPATCGNEEVGVLLASDGTGHVCSLDYDSRSELAFEHSFTREQLEGYLGETRDVLDACGATWIRADDEDDRIFEFFVDSLNGELHDPFIIGDLDSDEDLSYSGNGEDFEELLCLALIAHNTIGTHELDWEAAQVIEYESAWESAGTDYCIPEALPARLYDVVQAILDRFRPTGGTTEYCDGAESRQSGYCSTNYQISLNLTDAKSRLSARALYDAPRRLVELAATYDINLDFATWLRAETIHDAA